MLHLHETFNRDYVLDKILLVCKQIFLKLCIFEYKSGIVVLLKYKFIPIIEIGEKFCIRMCFNFFYSFLFSTQSQMPQLIIRLGRVIYHVKAVSVVIRTRFKNAEHFFQFERNLFRMFLFRSTSCKRNEQTGSFMLNLGILRYLDCGLFEFY